MKTLPYNSDLTPIRNEDYTYNPIKLYADNFLLVHPQNIFENHKPYIVKQDISWSYNFHNGFIIDLKKGDKILLMFDHYSQHRLNSPYRYHLYRENSNKQYERLGVIGNIAWDESKVTETYGDYSIEYVISLIKNLENQLEGKTPCLDKILNNQKPSYDIAIGDTFMGFGWDNGLVAKRIVSIEDDQIIYEYHNLSHYNYNVFYGDKHNDKTSLSWFLKYNCKMYFNYDDVVSDKLFYNEVIDEALRLFTAQKTEHFTNSYNELKTC